MYYLILILAFLLGGIPFGLIAGYLWGKGDIRRLGSGNIGATNVYRTAGPAAALLATIGDIGKGAAAVLICKALFNQSWPLDVNHAALIAGLVAILGHSFSPYLRFRGGKGVNTALGVFITLLPIETLIATGVFIAVVAASRFISLGSIAATLALNIILFFEKYALGHAVATGYLIAAVMVLILILTTHRQNIARLFKGEENRFVLKRAAK